MARGGAPVNRGWSLEIALAICSVPQRAKAAIVDNAYDRTYDGRRFHGSRVDVVRLLNRARLVQTVLVRTNGVPNSGSSSSSFVSGHASTWQAEPAATK